MPTHRTHERLPGMRRWRSVLFVCEPCRPHAKAPGVGADLVVLDLDDAVPAMRRDGPQHPEARSNQRTQRRRQVARRRAIVARSEEHTSELQSLMRISYAVFCLKIQ